MGGQIGHENPESREPYLWPEIFSLIRPNNPASHSVRQTFRTAPPGG